MDKETINKVLEVLSKHGIDSEILDEVETDLTGEAPKEEGVVEETTKEEVEGQPTDVPPVEEEAKAEEKVEEETDKDNDVPPVDDTDLPVEPEGDVPPVEEVKNPLPEGVEEVNLGEEAIVPPTEEPVLPEQPVEPEFDYRKAYEEATATIDGLKARLDSLEEALQKGGFIEEKTEVKEEGVGVDDPTKLSNGQSDETLMEDVVEELNRKRY